MLKKYISELNKQKGFTLIELLVSIGIAGIIGTTIIAMIFQIFSISSAISNHMEAIKQVENALHWINRDTQMAWPNSIAASGNTLQLYWDDTTVSPIISHNVLYSYDPGTQILQRVDQTNSETTLIADNISDLSYSYDSASALLSINVTATVIGVKSASENRTFQVKPRSGQ